MGRHDSCTLPLPVRKQLTESAYGDPETLCSDRAKAMAGQKLSQAGMSPGKDCTQSLGFTQIRSLMESPARKPPLLSFTSQALKHQSVMSIHL